MIEERRFGGIRALYGVTALEHFRNSHVCVIGVGGVGSWVAESLARSGIGHLTLFDMDHVTESNINRQLVALESTLGMAKVDVLKSRCSEINRACQCNAVDDFVTRENISSLLNQDFHLVFDCIDSFREKAAIIAYCKSGKIPVITVGGTGGKTDPTRLHISDLSRTEKDPLLSRVRKELRQNYNFPRNLKRRFSVPAVYSTEEHIRSFENDHYCAADDKKSHLNCGGLGSVTHVTATAGFYAVSRGLSILSS